MPTVRKNKLTGAANRDTVVVRVSEKTRAAAEQLALEHDTTMTRIFAEAVERLRRHYILKETNERYAELRDDPEAWAEIKAERELWDSTLSDGLEGLE